MGTVNVSVTGKQCLAWTSHGTSYPNERFPDGSPAAARNYCRNPDRWSTVWCWTSASWETCDVPMCGKIGCHFYRAMHFSANARSWDRMSSVCLSVCLSVCNVGDL